MARFAVGVPLVLLFASVVSARNPPQSDPQAVSLANKAMAALTNGVAVSDVTLNASVTSTVGSDYDTGNATFRDTRLQNRFPLPPRAPSPGAFFIRLWR